MNTEKSAIEKMVDFLVEFSGSDEGMGLNSQEALYDALVEARCLAAEEKAKPTPDKAEEPLACLADRKGLSVYWIKKAKTHWVIILCSENYRVYVKQGVDFTAPTYAAAEQAAREYLNRLEDKK